MPNATEFDTAAMLELIRQLNPEARAELDAILLAGDAPLWVPQDGPQRMAYESEADNGMGDALEFNGAASDGVFTKSTSQAWTGINVASGLATFYRHVNKIDGGAASATERRLQGTVGAAGADMNLTNPSLVASAPQSLDYYAIAIPMM